MSSIMASSGSISTIFLGWFFHPPYLFLSFIRVVFPAPQGVLDVEPEKLIGGFSQNDGAWNMFPTVGVMVSPPKKYTAHWSQIPWRQKNRELKPQNLGDLEQNGCSYGTNLQPCRFLNAFPKDCFPRRHLWSVRRIRTGPTSVQSKIRDVLCTSSSLQNETQKQWIWRI